MDLAKVERRDVRNLHLLLIDDDPSTIRAVRESVQPGWKVFAAPSLESVPDLDFHVACISLSQDQQALGLSTIAALKFAGRTREIIAFSSACDLALMEECLQKGASQFLAKPLRSAELRMALEKLASHFDLETCEENGKHPRVRWVGTSEESKAVRKAVARLRGEKTPIILEGESGSGKEVVAHLLHNQDGCGPMVCVNMASIPDNLFESEFFGHVRGAFTGADQNKIGLAEAAHGGDLFLDEIEALPYIHQSKLLRFLETGEVRRVGARDSTYTRVRVIAATNQNLDDLTHRGLFRSDLLYRLAGHRITLPPLRERLDDILPLANHFLSADLCRQKYLSAEALAAMQAYHWPGNVRELKRVCEQALVVSPLPVIRAHDLRELIRPKPFSNTAFAVNLDLGLSTLLDTFEASVITKCLEHSTDVDMAARTLKVSRSNLYKKIKDLKITWKA
jgi:DNA-binding NtrC family response regulator